MICNLIILLFIGVKTTAVKDQGYCGSCWFDDISNKYIKLISQKLLFSIDFINNLIDKYFRAFSVTEQIESDSIISGFYNDSNIITLYQSVGYLSTSDTLSPQQIVSCDTTDYGCDGGNTETAYAYVIKAGGLSTNSAYPYSSYYGTSGSCLTTSSSQYILNY